MKIQPEVAHDLLWPMVSTKIKYHIIKHFQTGFTAKIVYFHQLIITDLYLVTRLLCVQENDLNKSFLYIANREGK